MSRYPEACFLGSAYAAQQFLPDDGAEVAFVGRSNSGKSSAINAIVGRRQLARTSRTPGRTQLVNFFGLAPGRRLIDLPGYGYARVPQQTQTHWQALIGAYFESRRSLVGLILVVDARRGLGEGDRRLRDWAASLGHPVHILLTKADKLSRAASRAVLAAVVAEVQPHGSAQLFSAETRDGVAEAQGRMQALFDAQKNASGAEYRGTPEANRTGLG
jgi:GTP-binding protein